MLTNRITRIKVVENGKTVKVIPNATINYNLDFNSMKKMVKLAIRLSPQDPLYEVDNMIVFGKENEEIPIIEDDMELPKSIIRASSTPQAILNGEPISMTVSVYTCHKL